MFAKLFELRDKKLKDNKKKGFTLVEMIVVLVILAILAALLIPALTGYINKAKEKSITAETRQVVMAAQTIADEQYGKLTGSGSVTIGLDKTNDTTQDPTESNSTSTINLSQKEIAKLAEVTAGNIDTVEGKDGKITKIVYKNDGKTCTYELKKGDDGYDLTSKGTYTVK